MDRFWTLLEKSTITSGLIALALVITLCVLVIKGMPVPDILTVAIGTVLGFFFGSKTERAYRRSQ